MHTQLDTTGPRLSGQEQRLYYSLLAAGRWAVTTGEAAERLGIKLAHATIVLHRLARKGVLARVGKGIYAVSSPTALASGARPVGGIDPYRALDQLMDALHLRYYAGFVTACFLHGIADELPFSVQIATPVSRRPVLLGDNHVRFHRVAEGMMFGTVRLRLSGEYLTVSDREKTLLDCAYRMELAGGLTSLERIAAELAPDLDSRRFRHHSARFPAGPWARRLGFLLERLSKRSRQVDRGLSVALGRRVGGGACALDPNEPPNGARNEKWGVTVNTAVPGWSGD